ncbi:bacterio-opsin activator [Natronolimnobius sp. AArcel1]|uniref:helix-turn-helix domain-containing protein n=1 Tax=Natronolimnobius sp. AArcel1 TaxID=1679093 RepID=UPI0013ECE87A|nr:helix-turn-helix domain-containing protein [Natronolimnobius sp. AArcel1]NGM68193.1 bacterio-opsin activator [Natronolimnobius sp. AArcel1]
MSGFRATIMVRNPQNCPVASISAETADSTTSVTRTQGHATSTVDETVVEEFTLPGPAALEDQPADSESGVELTTVQSNEHESVYRFERTAGTDCACEIVEQTGTPLSSVRAQDGALLLSFHTLELEEIAGIVDNLRDRFDGVLVEELSQGPDGESADPVVVDRNELTDRQREILEKAYEMGYFDYPKGANATDVAAELGVARSTFTEHLAAAQTKLMSALLDK